MLARYTSAISVGTLMTLALFYLMQALISMQPGVISDSLPRFAVDWIYEKVPEDPPPPIEKPFDKNKLIDIPRPPDRVIEGDDGISVVLKYDPAPPGPGSLIPTGLQMTDGPLVSLLLVRPTYPISAARKGLEGYVLVQFDVLSDGYVANVAVIESSNPVFESAAIKAAERFRFRPKVVDGVPQVSTGIQNVFRFRMED